MEQNALTVKYYLNFSISHENVQKDGFPNTILGDLDYTVWIWNDFSTLYFTK